ncbi:MAG: penicillin-binding protein 1B, partial [Desulfuromonadaceae bacterium]
MARSRKKQRKWKGLALGGLILVLLAAAGVRYLDVNVRDRFEGKRFAIPSKVYARALELYPGLSLSSAALQEELALLGYRPVEQVT